MKKHAKTVNRAKAKKTGKGSLVSKHRVGGIKLKSLVPKKAGKKARGTPSKPRRATRKVGARKTKASGGGKGLRGALRKARASGGLKGSAAKKRARAAVSGRKKRMARKRNK